MKVAEKYFICPDPISWYLGTYGVLKRNTQEITSTTNNITGVYTVNHGLFVGTLTEIINYMKENPRVHYYRHISKKKKFKFHKNEN